MNSITNAINNIPVKKLNRPIVTPQQKADIVNNRDSVSLGDLYPAPNEWNFYGELPAEKMNELVESVLTLGILHPIIVWERPNADGKKYMILSGHNRVKAYKILRANENDVKYSRIEAVIKGPNEIDEDIAQDIIIDTNWVQRELSPSQKAKTIMKKYISLKGTTDRIRCSFKISDVIAKEYNISSRQIMQYKSLAGLLPEIQSLLDEGKISIKAGVRLSKFSNEEQGIIYDKVLSKNNFNINKKYTEINTEMKIKDVIAFLNDTAKTKNKFIIRYPDREVEGKYKEAVLTCPSEDCGYFEDLLQTFCDEKHDNSQNIFDKESLYESGEFIFIKK